MNGNIDRRLGLSSASSAGFRVRQGVRPTRRSTGTSWSVFLVHVMASGGSTQRPAWVIRRPDPKTARRTGLCHLMREHPAITTLCGLEKPGWQRWPPGLSRPPMEMCCKRCMTVATKEILEGRYEPR